MKQRLGIAATLIGNPKVIILDEPTNGLDAEGIADVRELILNIAKTGTTVLLASHLLDEIQKVCTNILIIKSGTKIKEGQINEVLTQKNGIKLSLEDVYLTSLSQN